MAATRTVLKQYFKKYATPTEEQFAALIDAFVHKDEDSLTQSKIDGLTAALESKVSASDLASAVVTAVEETLQGGNIEVTPAAHQHAIADVEDLQAFVTKVNNFLESADVSDETINRWVEIETFLTGITDQETLAGLLLNLKNEILAQIPEPQTGNYLKQISDLDAYTEAQEGEIVQYVGTSTADYTRGFCYEKTIQEIYDGLVDLDSRQYECIGTATVDGVEYDSVSIPNNDDLYIKGAIMWNSNYITLMLDSSKIINGRYLDNVACLPYAYSIDGTNRYPTELKLEGGRYNIYVEGEKLSSTTGIRSSINRNTGQFYLTSKDNIDNGNVFILLPVREDFKVNCNDVMIGNLTGRQGQYSGENYTPKVIHLTEGTFWQPIATSPVVS